MNVSTSFIQTLESRTLFSHVVHGPASDNPTIVADQQQLNLDLLKMQNDRTEGLKKLAAEREAMRHHGSSMDGVLLPLKQKLEADKQAMDAALKADREAGQPVRDADRPAIMAD